MVKHEPATRETPEFCPRCKAVGAAGNRLCSECGETLAKQGFCPICESYWKLRQGVLCPKHEVELEEPPSDPGPDALSSRLVAIRSYPSPNEANAARIRLQAEGIPTFLDGERMGSQSLYQVATGGVRLMVPEDLAPEARVILNQTWAVETPEDDLEDAFETLAPEPGRRRRAIMKGAILLFLFGPTVIAVVSVLLQSLARR